MWEAAVISNVLYGATLCHRTRIPPSEPVCLRWGLEGLVYVLEVVLKVLFRKLCEVWAKAFAEHGEGVGGHGDGGGGWCWGGRC